MAKVAAPGSLSSNPLPFRKGAPKVQAKAARKRKTPSELRGEQLKQKNRVEHIDQSPSSLRGPEKIIGMVHGLKKPDVPKISRYINTRMVEMYPVRKCSNMCQMLYGKEKAVKDGSSEQLRTVENDSCNSDLPSKSQPQISCHDNLVPSAAPAKDSQTSEMGEKCTQNTFRGVAELSLGSERLSGSVMIDMDKALKGLVAREPMVSCSPADSSERFGDITSMNSGSFSSEIQIPGCKAPLDLTLKTAMRMVSSSSVNWCHRSNLTSTYNGMTQFISQFGCSMDPNLCRPSELTSTAEIMYAKALYSWVYPQSCFPPSVVSALTLSAARGEADFLLSRQLAWEDSFRSLYFMLRKNICNIFYVCTSQFVVMFTCNDCLGRANNACNAYVSQSTRGLRSLLREHDIRFHMPLCHSEVEHATAEDLVEISEIEKHNLGQARRLGSMSDVDNSPQSLLAFNDNESVHGLFDFLLNYRFFLSSLTGTDVPLLYSSLPFQNASLCVPKVRCKEMKRAETVAFSSKGAHKENDESNKDSSAGVCYSIEVNDTFLPPWTICGICAAMGSEGKSFEASFTTDPISIGLNVALESACKKSDPQSDLAEDTLKNTNVLGVTEAVISPCLLSASLRGLKYSNGSYKASLSPLYLEASMKDIFRPQHGLAGRMLQQASTASQHARELRRE